MFAPAASLLTILATLMHSVLGCHWHAHGWSDPSAVQTEAAATASEHSLATRCACRHPLTQPDDSGSAPQQDDPCQHSRCVYVAGRTELSQAPDSDQSPSGNWIPLLAWLSLDQAPPAPQELCANEPIRIPVPLSEDKRDQFRPRLPVWRL